MREYLQGELQASRERAEQLGEEIRAQMLARDPNDGKDVIIEIRAGAGGDEAALFAGELCRMYTRHAQSKGFEVDVLSTNEAEAGGFKEVILEVRGQGAYSAFKYESGVHRVQRVPVTEAAGRIHTSTVTVAVLPEAEDIEVDIHPNDLRIDIFRSSGPGGQSVNTTDSAVRITHLPDRCRGELPRREEPAAEQGAGVAHLARPPLRDGARRAGQGAHASSGAAWSAPATARRRSAPTISSRIASATTASASRRTASTRSWRATSASSRRRSPPKTGASSWRGWPKA